MVKLDNIFLIAVLIVLLTLKIAQNPYFTTTSVNDNDISMVQDLILFSCMIGLNFFTIRFVSHDTNRKRQLFLMSFIILFDFIFISMISFLADDEMMISYLSYHGLLQGMNPYATSYASALVPALNSIQVSPTVLNNGS